MGEIRWCNVLDAICKLQTLMFVVRINVACISAFIDCLAFALTRLFASAHITNGGSGGIMSTTRLELPYACISKAMSWSKTSRRGK